ncbi:MAG: cation:proton antiporter [Actinophytocola sp.]|uniref:cation:proton antiporter n=1 Tax=Actinophytocola sp. TaxID=1872138 RepID=UPI003C726C3F
MNLSAEPIAPMSGHQVLVFVTLIGLLLGSALLLGLLARRLGLPSVIGELCAGVLIGPSIVGTLVPDVAGWLQTGQERQLHLVDAVGYLGVLLLVGITGIGIDVGLLRRRAGATAWVSATALVLPLAAGVALGLVLPDDLVAQGADRVPFAAFVGVAMCVSAVPVIAKTLLDMRLLHRDVGQLIMGSATASDLVGWLLLSVVSAMATVGVRAANVLLPVAFIAGLVLICMTVARPSVGYVLRLAGRTRDHGAMTATVVLLLFAFAALTQALHLEAVLGAMLGGMVIGSSKYLDREKLAPLRTFVTAVLAPLFFATAGLRMDLTALARPTVLAAAGLVLVVAVVTKFAGAYLGARTARMGRWESMALGAGLNARGAIEVIIAIVGLQLGVLTTEMYTIIILVAIITSLTAPPMLRLAARNIEVTAEEKARDRWLNGPTADDNADDDDGPTLRAA